MAFTRPTSLPPNRRVGTWVQQRPRGADIRWSPRGTLATRLTWWSSRCARYTAGVASSSAACDAGSPSVSVDGGQWRPVFPGDHPGQPAPTAVARSPTGVQLSLGWYTVLKGKPYAPRTRSSSSPPPVKTASASSPPGCENVRAGPASP